MNPKKPLYKVEWNGLADIQLNRGEVFDVVAAIFYGERPPYLVTPEIQRERAIRAETQMMHHTNWRPDGPK